MGISDTIAALIEKLIEEGKIPADYEQTSKQAINAKVHRLLYDISTDREPVSSRRSRPRR